jgi:hypothetical protein
MILEYNEKYPKVDPTLNLNRFDQKQNAYQNQHCMYPFVEMTRRYKTLQAVSEPDREKCYR